MRINAVLYFYALRGGIGTEFKKMEVKASRDYDGASKSYLIKERFYKKPVIDT